MTRDDVIRMAIEAGLFAVPYPHPTNSKEVERFAALVAAAEREEAAALFLSIKTRLTEERDALRAELSKQQALTDAAQHIAEVAQSRANQLQSKITEMEQQEPAGTLHDDGYFVWRKTAPYQSNYAGWKTALYALPGAKGE